MRVGSRSLPVVGAVLVSVVALTGCTRNASTGAGSTAGISVRATEADCAVSVPSAKSGSTVFSITNAGQRTTEFEILAEDGLTVVGELENIGPGLTRTLSVQAQPGRYSTMCRPGMTGSGVGRASFTVSGERVALHGDAAALASAAAGRYRSYVRTQVDGLVSATNGFVAAYSRGDNAAAKQAYPRARAFYERIEPVSEAFTDLDPRLDAREGNVAKGAAWTGWHRIEKDLWAPGATRMDASERRAAGAALVSATAELRARVSAAGFTPTADSITNGAVGLLDEVAKSKVTGEEERYSHTDLWDFAANVEGAEVAYRGVREIVAARDRQLAATLDARFSALQGTLSRHGSLKQGFAPYTQLSATEVRSLSDQVTALAEPLSQLTATVLHG